VPVQTALRHIENAVIARCWRVVSLAPITKKTSDSLHVELSRVSDDVEQKPVHLDSALSAQTTWWRKITWIIFRGGTLFSVIAEHTR